MNFATSNPFAILLCLDDNNELRDEFKRPPKKQRRRRDYEKDRDCCPECGSDDMPMFGPARLLTNPECRSGAWVFACSDCLYVFSWTF